MTSRFRPSLERLERLVMLDATPLTAAVAPALPADGQATHADYLAVQQYLTSADPSDPAYAAEDAWYDANTALSVDSAGADDPYSDYLAAVITATSQYRSSASTAYTQYLGQTAAATSSAQSQAGDAYAAYQSASGVAYSAYNDTYTQAYTALVGVVNDANAALTAAAAAANTAWVSSLSSATTAANTSFLADKAALDAALSAAKAQYDSDSQAANGDSDALAAATGTYLDAVAKAAADFNASELAVAQQAGAANVAATNVLSTTLQAADAGWTATVQPAYNSFVGANTSAWNGYVAAESVAWGQYQDTLASINAQQQATYDAVNAPFQSTLAIASTAFSAQESAAWNAYQQAAGAGQAGVRLSSTPVTADMPLVPVAANAPGDRVANGNQGKPPPIDWSQGTLVERHVVPWPRTPDVYGDIYAVEIGKDANGQPILVYGWHGLAPFPLQFQYFCHGLTFTSGAWRFSPVGSSVDTILNQFYTSVNQGNVKAGDVVVWRDAAGNVIHSCIIVTPVFNADGTLDMTRTIVRTKNGNFPENSTATLAQVDGAYNKPDNPSTWMTYTRK